jgi:hypothetical protein
MLVWLSQGKLRMYNQRSRAHTLTESYSNNNNNN